MIWIFLFLIALSPARAERADAEAAYAKHFAAYRAHDFAAANKWGKIATDKGGVAMMLKIARKHDDGQSRSLYAYEYFEMAAKKGSAMGSYMCGAHLLRKNPIKFDRDRARKRLNTAIELARQGPDPEEVEHWATAKLKELDGLEAAKAKEAAKKAADEAEEGDDAEDSEDEASPSPSAPPSLPAPAPVVASAPAPAPAPAPAKKQEFPNASNWYLKTGSDQQSVLFLTIYGWNPETDVYEVRRRDRGPEGYSFAMQKMPGDELRKGWQKTPFDPSFCGSCKGSGKELRRGEDKTGFTTVYNAGGPGNSLSSGMYGARTTEATYSQYTCSKCDGRGWFKPSWYGGEL